MNILSEGITVISLSSACGALAVCGRLGIGVLCLIPHASGGRRQCVEAVARASTD